MGIRISVESERGCGFRQEGGLYLVGGRVMEECNKLPIPLDVCPTCKGGIKFSRGWTWADLTPIVKPGEHQGPAHDLWCPMGVGLDEQPRDLSSSGLLWVGERSYSPQSFVEEAIAMGVSRRINFIPRKLKIGESVIFLAHRKVPVFDGIATGKDVLQPAIFTAFIPTHIEYVVKDDESEEALAKLEKRGIELVKVVRNDEDGSVDEEGEAA